MFVSLRPIYHFHGSYINMLTKFHDFPWPILYLTIMTILGRCCGVQTAYEYHAHCQFKLYGCHSHIRPTPMIDFNDFPWLSMTLGGFFEIIVHDFLWPKESSCSDDISIINFQQFTRILGTTWNIEYKHLSSQENISFLIIVDWSRSPQDGSGVHNETCRETCNVLLCEHSCHRYKIDKNWKEIGNVCYSNYFLSILASCISGEIGESHGRHCGFKKKDIVSHSKRFAPSVSRSQCPKKYSTGSKYLNIFLLSVIFWWKYLILNEERLKIKQITTKW